MFNYDSQGVKADKTACILVEEYNNHVKITDSILEAQFKAAAIPAGVVDAARQAIAQDGRNYVHEIGAAPGEEAMYGPLIDMIVAVVQAVPANERLHHRHTIDTRSRKTDSSIELMKARRPDLTTFGCPHLVGHFRHSLALWKLEHRSNMGPGSSETAYPKEIIGQVADAIRLRAVSRPHQLFSLAIMICGTSFWVWMWDQSGVTYSHQHSLEYELDLFLRLVISVNCRMSAVDFGMNPDIQFPATYDFVPSANLAVKEMRVAVDQHQHPARFPTIKIGGYQWELRKNLFQSSGALGRGISIWHVARNVETDLTKAKRYIFRALKLSWRAQDRTSEHEIHARLKEDFRLVGYEQPDTIIRLNTGTGDSGNSDDAIHIFTTVHDLRGGTVSDGAFKISGRNLKYDGILFARIGKAIHQYSADMELLKGARDILKGLMSMNQVGWMHRDVSAGNCLHTCDPADEPSFVSDIELAKKMGSKTSPCSSAISGTMQFMARELLESFNGPEPSDFAYQPHHDLESWVYVIVYAVMKRECIALDIKNTHEPRQFKATMKAQLKRMVAIFHHTFGSSTTAQILAARSSLADDWFEYKTIAKGKNKQSSVLHDVITELLVNVGEQNAPPKRSRFQPNADENSTPMEARKLLQVVEQGIEWEKEAIEDEAADSNPANDDMDDDDGGAESE